MQAPGRKIAGRGGQARSLNTHIAAQLDLTTNMLGAAGAVIAGFMRMTHLTFGNAPATSCPYLFRSISTVISAAAFPKRPTCQPLGRLEDIRIDPDKRPVRLRSSN